MVDSVAVHHPLGRAVDVAAVGDVVDLHVTGGGDDAYVAVGVAAVGYQCECKPFAVRRPVVGELSVVLGAVGDLAHLAALEVEDLEDVAVLDEGHFLAVGRECGPCALGLLILEEGLLVDEGGVGKMQLVLPGHRGLVEVPASGALGGVDDGLAVGGYGDTLFGGCGAGYLLGGAVLAGGGEYLASALEDDLLAVIGDGYLGDTAKTDGRGVVDVVVEDADGHFLRLAALGQGVDFALPSEAEGAVGCAAEEAYGMLGKMGEGGGVLSVVHRCGVDVERASVPLAEEYHLAVTGEDGVAVLAGIGSNLGVGTLGGVIVEYVAGYR